MGWALPAGLALGVVALSGGCASLPRGSDFPKTTSSTLSHAQETRVGRQLAAGKAAHPGLSGFKLLPVGTDGFLLRMETAEAALRFAEIARPANSFVLLLSPTNEIGQRHLVWRTLEAGNAVDDEPDATLWKRVQVNLLSLLPLDELL